MPSTMDASVAQNAEGAGRVYRHVLFRKLEALIYKIPSARTYIFSKCYQAPPISRARDMYTRGLPYPNPL